MKKLFVVFGFILSVIAVSAHEQGSLYIQPKIGCSLYRLMGVDTYGARLGFTGGVELEGFLTDNMSLSIAAQYSMQGGKKDYYIIDSNFDAYGIETSLKANYLQIPFMANFYVYKGLGIRMGFQFSITLYSHCKQSATGIDGNLSDIGYKAREYDLSIPVGLMYEFNNGIVLDARYNISTSKFMLDADGTRHSGFMLTVGYKFKHD